MNTTTKTNARSTKPAAAQPRARKTRVAAAASTATGPAPDDTRVWNFTAAKQAIADIKMPSWMKTAVGFLAAVVTFGCTYYVGVSFAISLGMLVGTLTGSFFLAWLTYFVGVVITVLLSLYSGARAQQFIVEDGYKTILAAPKKVFDWFGRAKAAVNNTAPA